jgi:hypothetical protein
MMMRKLSSKAAAPIKRIARWEFNQLLPYHLVLEDLMGRQIGWFANEAESLLGTIALTKVGRSWNFAVLRRNTPGNFKVCDIGQNFFNLRQTMVQFKYAMVAAKNCREEALLSSD